jgi:hypothetical protein
VSAWIGIVGTVVGAAIAGGLLYFRDAAQRRYSRQAERRALVIGKYEQLHKELSEIDTSVGALAVALIGHASLRDNVTSSELSSSTPLNSALMHATFYVPQLLPQLEALQPQVVELYRIAFKLNSAKDGSESERLALAESGMEISFQVSRLVTAAKAELGSLARKSIHGEERFLGVKSFRRRAR